MLEQSRSTQKVFHFSVSTLHAEVRTQANSAYWDEKWTPVVALSCKFWHVSTKIEHLEIPKNPSMNKMIYAFKANALALTLIVLAAPSLIAQVSFEAMPEELVIECTASDFDNILSTFLASNAGATATTECSSQGLTWTNDYDGLSQNCGAAGATTIIFTATDECGYWAAQGASFIIEDTTAPTIITPPSDRVVNCDPDCIMDELNSWLANNGGAEATDNCGSVTWTNDFEDLDCETDNEVFVAFYAHDDCGLFAYQTAKFTANCNEVSAGILDIEEITEIYPSPASNYVQFRLPASSVGSSFSLGLYDLSGKNVLSKEVVYDQNSNRLDLPASMENGRYILRLVDNHTNNVLSSSFMVAR